LARLLLRARIFLCHRSSHLSVPPHACRSIAAPAGRGAASRNNCNDTAILQNDHQCRKVLKRQRSCGGAVWVQACQSQSGFHSTR
jgi:hypothetical protein